MRQVEQELLKRCYQLKRIPPVAPIAPVNFIYILFIGRIVLN
jgi:hypothetical protein